MANSEEDVIHMERDTSVKGEQAIFYCSINTCLRCVLRQVAIGYSAWCFEVLELEIHQKQAFDQSHKASLGV